MQVFKAFYKLLWANRKTIMIYLIAFLSLIILLTKLVYSSSEKGYTKEHLKVGVVDLDQSEYSDVMLHYFEENHDLKLTRDDQDAILEALYWKDLDYVVRIPSGFCESLKAGEAAELSGMRVPGSFDAEFFEADLTMFNTKLSALLAAGYTVKEAGERLDAIMNTGAEVELASFVNENQNDVVSGLFSNLPYFYLAVGVVAVGIVLVTFNRREVKDRTECSPTSLKERTAGMVLGVISFGGLLLVISFVLVLIFTGGEALFDSRMPYFMLNALAVLIFALSVGFFAGNISKNVDAMNGIVNITSMLFCFLGGIFVPQSLFSEGILRVAKLVPTYWYIKNNEMISQMVTADAEFLKKMAANCSISILAACVVFVLTMVMINAKRKRV